MFASLYGDMKPGIPGLAEAGIYVEGTFLKTTLTLENKVKPSKKTMDVSLRSFF